MTTGGGIADPVFHWFLPVRGYSRDPGVVTPADGTRQEPRLPSLQYLTLVAQAAEQAANGDHTDHDSRSAATDEALQVIAPLLEGERVSVEGRYVGVTAAALPRASQHRVPIYFGGASTAATAVPARPADAYLLWAEPLQAIAQHIDDVRSLARAPGRHLRFGLRIRVLSRDTDEQAWAEADRIRSTFDPAVIQAVQRRMGAWIRRSRTGWPPCMPAVTRPRASRPPWSAATTKSPTG